jgi:hypothetical protein
MRLSILASLRFSLATAASRFQTGSARSSSRTPSALRDTDGDGRGDLEIFADGFAVRTVASTSRTKGPAESGE